MPLSSSLARTNASRGFRSQARFLYFRNRRPSGREISPMVRLWFFPIANFWDSGRLLGPFRSLIDPSPQESHLARR